MVLGENWSHVKKECKMFTDRCTDKMTEGRLIKSDQKCSFELSVFSSRK